ncbi:hypothetical protein GYMLUDRAFT_131872, partial [Collybiopsis luxurians FD-317 M1]
VFNENLLAWVPVLYTYMDGLDAGHHQPHFRHLFHQIADYAGEWFNYFLQVMDFSSAQIKAHSQEYADIMMKLFPGSRNLSQGAYHVQHAHFVKEANEVQVGCQVHFYHSGKRLAQNGVLVPSTHREQFMHFLHIMVAKSTSADQWTSIVDSIRASFPQIEGWLEWWLQPAIASMIFPAVSNVDPGLAHQVPSTTNPIEAQHFNLHLSLDKGHDALAGVHRLYLYVKMREDQYKAVM